MAGVKGRSGGARPNSGGSRPGAGRPPKPPAKAPELEKPDMLAYLVDVAMGRIDANAIQVRAAIAAVQYTHTRRADGGKKEETAEKAKKAAAGRFATRQAPLKLVGG